jgi:hypothetical protein
MAPFQIPFPKSSAPNVLQLRFSHTSPGASAQPQTPGTTRMKKSVNYLPGFPNIPLDRIKISEFMRKELCTPTLDELYPRLWLVARKSYWNIDPLHRQATKRRTICLTEDVQLHLLWQDDKIYIKPVPPWLLNYEVWLHYLSPAPEQASSNTVDPQKKDQAFIPSAWEPPEHAMALGFLRSYAYLIQHQSDFIVAHQQHLVPPTLDWISWSRFIAYFRDTEDHQVSNRYHYGQLRLSRLHWAVRLFRPRTAPTWWFYSLPHWSTTPYLHSILAPLAFTFATLSLVLSAMQVVVSVPADGLRFSGVSEIGLENMRRAFWIFSIGLIISSGVIWVLLAVILLNVLVWQLVWGFNHRHNVPSSRLSRA